MMTGRLEGRHLLIVEDEYFIAADMKRALLVQGAIIVGPVGQLTQGLSLAGQEPLDAAILDVNLGTATTYPIADRLRERDTPWMFVTGYDDWSMPPAYRDTPRLAKPFTMKDVIETVVGMIAHGAET